MRSSASARACSRPRSFNGGSACPWKRPSRFQSVSPWRARIKVVTPFRLVSVDLGLRDRVCLVTGSTSGIGLETARLLSAEGARVAICGRDAERVERARGDVHAAIGLVADLAEPGSPDELVAGVRSALGPVPCLVNNVGDAYEASFEELSDRQWEDMWQLNVMSYVRCIRAALPEMREAGGGTIVNVSSTAGKRPSTGM